MSISLAEERKIELSMEETSVADLLHSTMQAHAASAEAKRIRLTLDCPDGLSFSTDSRLLAECTGNLVSNAIRYTPEGGSVTIAARRDGSRMRIDVRDTGIGIPVHARERIFSKFYRAENAARVQADGIGLGLYLVSSFVTLLGGSASFESKEGEGSCFTLLLPLSPSPAA